LKFDGRADCCVQGEKMATVSGYEIRDADRDSVHILPLMILPLATQGLKRTRMIKNSDLKTVIEIFDDGKAVSGQMSLDSIHKAFSHIEPGDLEILRSVTDLYSFDVFCLRIQLRKLGIKVDDENHLKLSKSKQDELSFYMKQFTQRLILEIFGTDDDEVKEYSDITALFHHPDVQLARTKLQTMAERLGTDLSGVPVFLEDYGDIYLSVAYYRQCMDQFQPAIQDFEYSVKEILNHNQLRFDQDLVSNCNQLLKKIKQLNTVAGERFAVFAQSADEMWEDISEDSFSEFKGLVESNHTAIGAILCTLSIKMQAWRDKFPNRSSGGPVKRAEYIRSDMRQGF
jgi:hypothetical protein